MDKFESMAFTKRFNLPPYQPGPLSGLTFAVKDLIDIAGHKTGAGNPTWESSHPVARCHAVCVEQLLSAGAACEGKTLTDELAFSLQGENYFYGTPLNPKAPDRVPGGSSSGSASAVACGDVDFALGTDTGGSVRVPASNCGIIGFRPSHGRISVAGVMPLAPSFDTVGVLAKSENICAQVAHTLLGCQAAASTLSEILLLSDAFALADDEVREALQSTPESLRQSYSIRQVSLEDILGHGVTFETLRQMYSTIQRAEVWSSLGAWIEDCRPMFGPTIAANFESAKNSDRTKVGEAIQQRAAVKQALHALLGSTLALCMPTTPAFALKKGSPPVRRSETLGFTALAGLAFLPQLTIPSGQSAQGVPMGLSFLAASGNDELLLETFRHGLPRL